MKKFCKTEKKLNSFWIIIEAILALFIGVFILNKENIFINIFQYIVAVYFLVTGMVELLKNTILKKDKKIRLAGILIALLNILIAVYISKYPQYIIAAFSIVFTAYIAITAIVKTIIVGIYLKNNMKGKFFAIIQAILAYVFTIVLCTNSAIRNDLIIKLTGIYFIALSITYILDVIYILIPVKYIIKLRRRTRIVLPVLIASFIPKTSLGELNKYYEKSKKVADTEQLEAKPDDENLEMEILIHIKNRGKEIFGHADIFFDGKIYAYGPYDRSTNIFQNLIGDGVLLETVEKQKYIDICLKYNSMTIVSFGIKITKEQKQAVKDRITKLKEDSYIWVCKAEQGIKNRDYASVVYTRTKASFFKFRQGQFKKYFSFGTNCVLFMDKIIGSLGIDIVRLTGIITPGTYYEYFNREYKLQNSDVIYKKVYKRVKKERKKHE